jgi:hypothetical protein
MRPHPFPFTLAVAAGTVPSGAAGAQPAAWDPAAAGGGGRRGARINLRWVQGGHASVGRRQAGADREEEIGSDGGREAGKRGLKLLSHQSLARDEGQARFHPWTPTSSDREAEDGNAPNFFCGLVADEEGVCSSHFFSVNLHIGGYFAGRARMGVLLELF